MGRVYSASFQAITVTAAQDLFEFVCGSAVAAVIHEIHVTQGTSETSEQLLVTLQRVTGFTTGTGGSTLTPQKHVPGDAASVCTVKANQTGRAAGTRTTLQPQGDNVLNGWHWLFSPETRPVVPPGAMLCVGLEAAPTSMPFSGTLTYEEIG